MFVVDRSGSAAWRTSGRCGRRRRSRQRSTRRLRATPLSCGWRRPRPIARRLRRTLRSCTFRPHCGFTPTKNTNKRSPGSLRGDRAVAAARARRLLRRRVRIAAAPVRGGETPIRGPEKHEGFVGEAAALGEADAAQALRDFDEAAKIYEDILDEAAVDVPAIWLSLANAALAAGDRKRAAEAFLHLYYEFPFSEHAVQAEGPLQTLPDVQQIATGNARYKLEMGRGERLFGSRRYPDARTSFLRLKPHATSEQDAELVSLRLAEIEYFQGRYSNAREALRPFLTTGARQAEARFFYLMSQRGLAQRRHVRSSSCARCERDFPEQHVGRRSAQSSRHVLHSAKIATTKRMRFFGSCTRSSRAAATRSARRGKRAGRRIAKAT